MELKNQKIKVLTFVGTRPELIKLSKVIEKLDKYTNHTLAHTGQNFDYELNEIFFKQLNIRKPNIYLNCVANNPAETIGNIIKKCDVVIKKVKPDAFLIYGDTNSCLSVISAKRNKIPIFHLEAGNRCFDQRVPEEINRKIVDHLSDINMPLSQIARDYLISEGIQPQQIIKIGSPLKEVIGANLKKIKQSKILTTLNLKKKNFILASFHREENVDNDKNLVEILDSLSYVQKVFKKRIIISTHPRTRIRLENLGINPSKTLEFLKPFGPLDYYRLQSDSYCVISDSGSITEDSSILGFPSITIRNTHERPEGMERGTLILSGLNKYDVSNSIKLAVEANKDRKIVEDYNDEFVSSKVLKIIYSYHHYVQREVWKKF